MSEDVLYEFTADYATHLGVAIKRAGFSARSPNIDAANFPALGYGRKRLYGVLIEIPELAEPEFPFKASLKRSLRLAEVREVISFLDDHPQVVAEVKLAALGVCWQDRNGRRGVPVAHCRDGDRRLELLWLGGRWGKRYGALGILVDP